jgi:hypothetical protein
MRQAGYRQAGVPFEIGSTSSLQVGFVLVPFRVVDSARKSSKTIVKVLSRVKAPDRKASKLTSRVNSIIFALSQIGFVWV